MQKLAAFLMAYDIFGGCLVYNSFPFKKTRYSENEIREYITHALIHMQPLLVALFFSEQLLPLVTGYWLVLYLTYMGLFEPKPRVSKKLPTTLRALSSF